jgi:hypothetical protein
MRKLAQILFRKHQLEHQKLSIPWIPSCRGPGFTLFSRSHNATMRAEFERIREGGTRLNFSGINGKNYHSRSLFGLAE